MRLYSEDGRDVWRDIEPAEELADELDEGLGARLAGGLRLQGRHGILGDGGPRHQEIVRILLASGADRTIADKNGVTALRHAEQKGYTAIAALLRA